MEPSRQAPRAGARVFDALVKFVVRGASGGCLTSTVEIEAKARLLPGSPPQRRAQIANAIHDLCIANVRVTTREDLVEALKRLRRRFVHAGNGADLMRLHGALMRFTHSTSFFTVCAPTVRVTLATLVASVLVGELMQAVDMAEAVERVIYTKNRPMASELADLLELKYGLVNLAQYRLMPALMEEAGCCDELVRAGAPGASADSVAEMEAERLLEMPVRSSALSRLCDFMVRRGASPAHAASEFAAGLKIEELPADAVPEKSLVPAPAPADFGNVVARTEDLLDRARKESRGEVLNGEVTSPLGAVGQSPFDGITLEKFVLLEYLHVMKMLANCIAQRSCKDRIRVSVNTQPFKTTSVAPTPVDPDEAADAEAQCRALQQRLQVARPVLGNHTQPY
ncbi:virion core protein [Pseudocowpox virus]|uniref:Assembly protein G7 n=1 Tax=Pseudocowpox virus TaxID=129726 RepID=D3IZ60_9POXV|nr:virion core protein [Pseudocowpox virus]